jgi:predicted nucleic acid-binding protein
VEAVVVFLDANVLFSASLGGPSFELLWELAELGRLEFVTSHYCPVEAERNLRRKYPGALVEYRQRLECVRKVPDADMSSQTEAKPVLPPKDLPVYRAAVEAQADVLLTGDRRHFGHAMGRADLPLRIRTVRAFLLEAVGERT